MADFSHQPPRPAGQARNEQIRSEEDLTHVVYGPLGPMSVVPDNYVGPMAPNTVRQSEYERMTRVYGNIDSGRSSLQIDTSNFFKTEEGKDISLLSDPVAYMAAVQNAATFRGQYMGYMQDLVKTPAGLQLLEQLDSSKHATTIRHGNTNSALAEDTSQAYLQPDGSRGTGSKTDVYADPSALLWDGEMCQQGEKPWMADRPRFGFYHELVHAYHNNRGDAVQGGHGHAQCVTDLAWPLMQTEFQTVGLGPWKGAAVSENAIRAQMGAPLRETYSGQRWNGPDVWAQQKDAEEPPRHSPRR